MYLLQNAKDTCCSAPLLLFSRLPNRCLHSSATMGALVAALDTALAAPDAAAALTTTSTTRSSSPNQALVKALLGALLAASYSAELCEQVLAAGGAAPVGRLLQQCAAAGASSKQLPLVSGQLPHALSCTDCYHHQHIPF